MRYKYVNNFSCMTSLSTGETGVDQLFHQHKMRRVLEVRYSGISIEINDCADGSHSCYITSCTHSTQLTFNMGSSYYSPGSNKSIYGFSPSSAPCILSRLLLQLYSSSFNTSTRMMSHVFTDSPECSRAINFARLNNFK